MSKKREYNFSDYVTVFRKGKAGRALPFEFAIGSNIEEAISGEKYIKGDLEHNLKLRIKMWGECGYDYIPLMGSNLSFKEDEFEKKETVSLNHDAQIKDWKDFESYKWHDPLKGDYSVLDKAAKLLPEGMKLIVFGPDGVLENVINLLGFDNLCFYLFDEPELVAAVSEKVGTILGEYYRICSSHPAVGGCLSNDDWGFNSSTMISTADMKKYIIPHHRRIAANVHAAGKPVFLHSCGMLDDMYDIIIDDIKYDAKHSYEDKIRPVEKAYDMLSDRITVLGGIDVDFLARSTPEEITRRCAAMLEKTKNKGRYMLGSGNSVPDYVPVKNYLAMIKALNL